MVRTGKRWIRSSLWKVSLPGFGETTVAESSSRLFLGEIVSSLVASEREEKLGASYARYNWVKSFPVNVGFASNFPSHCWHDIWELSCYFYPLVSPFALSLSLFFSLFVDIKSYRRCQCEWEGAKGVVRCPFAILTQQPLLDNLSFGIEEWAGQAWQLFPPLFGFIASDWTRIVKLSKHIFVLHVLLVFLFFWEAIVRGLSIHTFVRTVKVILRLC